MIRLSNVSKVFGTGVTGLSDINLIVEKGEFVFLVGHTGSGKTTLLRLLVRDTLPTTGTIIVSDFDVVKLPSNKIPHLRKKVGVVFQDLKLLMDRTILENIILPMQVGGIQVPEAIKRAEELLERVGLSSHKEKFPIQLSGGELQRVAIARALALAPEILLADEPTGNLDPQTAKEIVDLLGKINELGTTIIMATHNLDIVEKMKKRVVGLEKGKVVKDEGKGAKHIKKSDEKEEKGEIANEAKEVEESSEKGNPEKPVEEVKAEEHKRETKKLSDLLAKARLTLHKKEEDKEEDAMSNAENMPFGFAKESDIKEEEPKVSEEKPAENKEEKKKK